MPKRKHRGGPSDRLSSRHHGPDSLSSSSPRSGQRSFGKSRAGLAKGGSFKAEKSAKSAKSGKPGWIGKPQTGNLQGSPWPDKRPDQGRRNHARLAPNQGSRPPLERHDARNSEPRRPERPGRNQVWLYGLHAVKAALTNPQRRPHRLLLTEDAEQALQSELSNINSLQPEIVARDAIGRILPPGAVHQGAALLAEPLPDVALEEVIDQAASRETSVVVILDQVTDPQNVGAILRSAAAFGADAVVVPDRHAPPETAALVKAASGAVEIVPLVRVVNLARAMEDLKAAGFWCAGLDGHAQQSLAAADMTGKVALVLGAEGEGLRRLTRDHCDILVRLPISDRMESLNVSAAAAVALYELAREA